MEEDVIDREEKKRLIWYGHLKIWNLIPTKDEREKNLNKNVGTAVKRLVTMMECWMRGTTNAVKLMIMI